MVWWFIKIYFCITPNRPELHTLKFHHGGGLYKEGDYDILSYNGCNVTHVDWVNSEELSFANLEGIVYDLGYNLRMEMYYKFLGSQIFEKILSNQEIVDV